MGEKLFFHWETQVIVITIVFELFMISSIIYVWWGIDFKEKLMESIARVAVILVIVAAQVSLSAQVPLWVRYGEGGIQKRRGSIATSLGFRKFARAPAASRKGMPQAKSLSLIQKYTKSRSHSIHGSFSNPVYVIQNKRNPSY